MGLRSLLFGAKSSASTTSSVKGHRNLRAHGYDSAVALEAPVRGSYPVAGNGPNVLDEIQRARAKKDVARKSTTLSRASSIQRSTAHPPTDVARWRENISERPQTAPHNGRPGGGQDPGFGGLNRSGAGDGRTKSGFTTNSPPVYLNKTRRNSLHTISREAVSPPIPSATPTPPRDVKAYQPTKATDEKAKFTPFTPPFAQHKRSDSRMSHRSYVDLLEAHSNIRPSQESSRHRAKASGMRNYGEDVADRNIKGFGSGNIQDGRAISKAFDVNAPEFSYLKNIYSTNSSKTTKAKEDIKSSTDAGSGSGSGTRSVGQDRIADYSAAASHVLGPTTTTQPQPHALSSDDIAIPTPSNSLNPSKSSKPTLRSRVTAGSNRSENNVSASASSPSPYSVPGPLRSRPMISTTAKSDTSSARSYSYTTSRGRDDRSVTSNGNTNDQSVRALSPMSTSSGSVYSDGPDEGPAPPIPARGRNRIARHTPPPAAAAAVAQLPSPVRISNPVPVSITSLTPKSSSLEAKDPAQQIVAATATRTATSKSRPEPRKVASVSFSDDPPQSILPAKYPPPSLKDRKRTMSADTHSGQSSPTLGHRPKNGSLTYSPYPVTSRGSPQGSSNGSTSGSIDSTIRPYTAPKRKEKVVQGAKETPSLKKVVGLSNTVDTVVTTKKPAVLHEHVTPTQHEIREENITREIHYHDVYHRILPVIETTILPTKHYIQSPDGKGLFEIPEHDVPGYTGRPLESINQGWKLTRTTEPPPLAKNAPTNHFRNSSVQKSLPSIPSSQQIIHQSDLSRSYDQRGSGKSSASGAARDESVSNHALSLGSSKTAETSSMLGHNPEPVLVSKETYMTEEGYPRTEYIWHHPPVFEDAQGRTQPIYMKDIFGGATLSSKIRSSSDEEDASGVNYGAIDSEGEMFRDSGYGEYTALPGLSNRPAVADLAHSTDGRSTAQKYVTPENAPATSSGQSVNVRSILKNGPSSGYTSTRMSNIQPVLRKPLTQSSPILGDRTMDDKSGEKTKMGKFPDDLKPRSSEADKTGEATNFLRRLRDKRRSSGDSVSIFRSWSKSKDNGKRNSMDANILLKGPIGTHAN